MTIKVFQRGFNYSQDGPGNRLVWHLQGCNMHCPWCANPEGVARDGVLMVKGGPLLDVFCPYGAIRGGQLDRGFCATCIDRPCVHSYRSRCLTFPCLDVEIQDLIEEAVRSRPLFFDGGGVTLSGGEPTLQFQRVEVLLTGLRKEAIHTAMESNATHPQLAALFPLLDLLILDFKCADSERHRQVTGVAHAQIKQNIAAALAAHSDVWVRIPLVEGVNTTEKDLEGFLDFFTKLDTRHALFEFLRYHEYGKEKYSQCGYPYTLDAPFVSDETLARFEQGFIQNGLRIIHT